MGSGRRWAAWRPWSPWTWARPTDASCGDGCGRARWSGGGRPSTGGRSVHAALGRAAHLRPRARRAARGRAGSTSIGIDTWAVDYGLLDATAGCSATRCITATRAPTACWRRSSPTYPPRDLYATTGCSSCRSTRCSSWSPRAAPPQLAAARTLLLIPDLLTYWLTGSVGAELTNASTTQLLDVTDAATWSTALMARLGIRRRCSRRCAAPGTARALRAGRRADDGPRRGARAARRLARHRLGRRRRCRPTTTVRLHLVRHLVAGRAWSSTGRC